MLWAIQLSRSSLSLIQWSNQYLSFFGPPFRVINYFSDTISIYGGTIVPIAVCNSGFGVGIMTGPDRLQVVLWLGIATVCHYISGRIGAGDDILISQNHPGRYRYPASRKVEIHKDARNGIPLVDVPFHVCNNQLQNCGVATQPVPKKLAIYLFFDND